MSGADPSARASDDAQALAALRDALGRFGACHPRGLAEAAILLCAFPEWAVWLLADRGMWTALRPAESVPPGPEAPMVWVRAETAGELAGMMQAADAQLPHERPQLDAATKPTETDSDGLNGKVGVGLFLASPHLIRADPLWEVTSRAFVRDAEPWINCGEQGLGSSGQHVGHAIGFSEMLLDQFDLLHANLAPPLNWRSLLCRYRKSPCLPSLAIAGVVQDA